MRRDLFKHISDLKETRDFVGARLFSVDLICSDEVNIREVITNTDLHCH